MYRLKAHINHLLTATNQHGVHSPFVYSYVTQCLYTKPGFGGAKTVAVLLKTIAFFKIQTIEITPGNVDIEKRIRKEFNLNVGLKKCYDLIYIDGPSSMELSDYEHRVHNDSMLLINNIHATKDATESWNSLKQNAKVTVSIDLFHCGLLFFRKEQAKEHFKIRI